MAIGKRRTSFWLTPRGDTALEELQRHFIQKKGEFVQKSTIIEHGILKVHERVFGQERA